jgi:hypothetical protein
MSLLLRTQYMKGGEQKMKTARIFGSGLIAVIATASISTIALADSASLSTTGPGSWNDVTISDSVYMDVSNSNSITVSNYNNQYAASGNASVSGNTVAGSANTGSAANNSAVSTNINVVNGAGANSGNVCTVNCIAVIPVVPTGSGGGVGGGSEFLPTGGKGGGMLPVTGPTDLVDVSALRSLYKPATSQVSSETGVVDQARKFSASLLLGALGLTLVGSIGSVMFAAKRNQVKG